MKIKREAFVLPRHCSASIYYLRFGTACRSHLQESRCRTVQGKFLEFWLFS